MSVSMLTRPDAIVLTYYPRGAAREIFHRHEPEVVLSGPAGTGKTRACLEKLHLAMCRHPGARGLIVRKRHTDLTATALMTFHERVLHLLDGVTFYGGSAREPAQFRYPNGSRVLVGGLDKATKIMSGEYDMVFVNEATELAENDWEALTTRLRHWVMPYQQLLGDCNPDAPGHWLKQRADAGKLIMLESRHEDNPELFDENGVLTEKGALYMAKLDALTGVRYQRLRKGIWAAAEGLVYDGWDPAVHLVDPVEVSVDWPRYLAVDFGYTNPFVCQWWAEDPDGRLYRYREIYQTKRLVEDHAKEIRRYLEREPRPRAIICDHDAEDRATLERHLGMRTVGANKAVSPGIQAVASRLKLAGDGKPRLFLLRGALIARDPDLVDAKLPTCTEEEIDGYVWADRRTKEEPVKENDHGCDALRYLVAHRDMPQASRKLITW